jgi:integrase
MLTEAELERVCRAARGELRYMVGLGIYTGLRLGDVVKFRWEYIDWRRRTFSLVPSKTGRGRRGASRPPVSFPLHPVLEALLVELRGDMREPKGYLFPRLASAYEGGQRGVATKRIQALFEACGIATHRAGTGKRTDAKGRVVDSGKRAVVEVGFHSLRHTFVSLCKANNVPQAAVQELVGHSSPAMTALYTHAGDELKARAVAALPAMSFAPDAEAGDA